MRSESQEASVESVVVVNLTAHIEMEKVFSPQLESLQKTDPSSLDWFRSSKRRGLMKVG